jgi:hypothetical protein
MDGGRDGGPSEVGLPVGYQQVGGRPKPEVNFQRDKEEDPEVGVEPGARRSVYESV